MTHLADHCLKMIFKGLHGIVMYYFQRGFQVTVVTGDGKFASLQECMVELPDAPRLNLASANEHEPYIEWQIHVVKERVHVICQSLSFTSISHERWCV